MRKEIAHSKKAKITWVSLLFIAGGIMASYNIWAYNIFGSGAWDGSADREIASYPFYHPVIVYVMYVAQIIPESAIESVGVLVNIIKGQIILGLILMFISLILWGRKKEGSK